MTKSLLTRRGAAVQGALFAFLAPRLAADAKIDLGPIVAPITTKNFAGLKPKIISSVTKATTGKLAADASVEGLAQLLDALEDSPIEAGIDEGNLNPGAGAGGSTGSGVTDNFGLTPPEDGATPKAQDDGNDVKNQIIEMLTGKLPEEDIAALMALIEQIGGGAPAPAAEEPPVVEADPAPAAPADEPPAEDETDEEADKLAELEKEKTAMDAALKGMVSKTAMDQALAAERKRSIDARAAEKAVRPYIGELAVAMDSAEAIYKHTLSALGVDVTGVPAAAYPAMLKLIPVPGAPRPGPAPEKIAADAAVAADFASRNPSAARIQIL